jgi:nucleotide-binding universal stress UspA family protein
MFGKILLAVDHSAAAERAISAARELPTLSDGEVIHLSDRPVLVVG